MSFIYIQSRSPLLEEYYIHTPDIIHPAVSTSFS